MYGMKAISWARLLTPRMQMALIGCGYAAVLGYAVVAQFMRHLAELRDPVSASGGMWAFGDELLAWNIFLFFMVPTFFLLLVLRQQERPYGLYSKILFWFSLTAPLSMTILVLAQLAHQQTLVDPLVWRIWRAPFVLILVAMSRIFARFDAAKRLLTRALLIEGASLVILFALLMIK
jgi:hypothetical protein